MAAMDPLPDDELVRKYVYGCHILHYHGIVDAYGHLSCRLSESVFLMSRYVAPALVRSREDIVLYDVQTGEPLRADAPRGFSERYIHSEIYKAYPGVRAVVHSHSLDVVPFSVRPSLPLRACIHMAGFLGTAVPVWDAAAVYATDESLVQSLLVRSPQMGASLARALGARGSSSDGGDEGRPRHPVALMRGHGFVCAGDGVEMVVAQSIYTAQNARVQRAAMGLGAGGADEGTTRFLSEREASDAGRTTIAGAAKPWPLWVAEVQCHPLYKNEV